MPSQRILALHGYHGSASVLRQQIAPIAAAFPPDIELVFVDAPSLAEGDFGWWHQGFRGWERTRDWVCDLVQRESFDGAFGFSQGAALAGLLAATQESDPSTPLNFRFAVMVGGFTSQEPQHSHLFGRRLRIPSLHVTGRADGVVPMGDSLLLAERFTDPVVIRHGGGHLIPNEPKIVTRVVEFVLAHGRDETQTARSMNA